MNTSNSKNLKSLAALSIIFLLAVLVYWNTDNYKRASVELKQDLADQMSLACGVYRDSIVQNLFRMIEFEHRLDTAEMTNNINVFADSRVSRVDSFIGGSSSMEFTLKVNSTKDFHVDSWQSSADTTIRVMFDAERDRKIIVWDSDVSGEPKSINIDPRPVKGIDWMTGISMDTIMVFDTSGMDEIEGSMPLLYIKIDSIFTNKLEGIGIQLDHQLTLFDRSDANVVLPEISVPLEYGNILNNGRPYAVFSDYKPFLLGKIAPSLLMSLLLLLVVGMSFYTILKSWLAQDRLTQVKNEFVSNMTHELKTPISTIGVAIEALENFGGMEDPVRRKEYLDISRHEVDRLKILVDKVLKMSTLDVEEELILTTEVDIRMLMDNMLKSMKLHLDKNNAILNYKTEGENFLVLGDKVHLTNVLYNLLDNALKYSKDEPQIDIKISANHYDIAVVISDEGVGVPSEYVSKVFDRFFRVPSNDRHNVKGHGLGLHYVKTIIEKHKGSVVFKNRLEKGSQLIIKLPRVHG